MTDGIVLIHAFPLDATMWDPQVETLSRIAQVVTPNLPGFGGMPPHGDVMTMSAAADQVAREIRDAGVTRAVVCGLSMGGYVAFALWRQHRDLVSGLVFANTRPDADPEAGRERRRALAERLRAEGNGFLAADPPPLLSADAPGELLTLVKGIIARQPADSIAAAALGMAERPDSTPDLAGIDVPTLVITSDADTLIPPEATKPIADGIANSRYEVIEKAGHLSNLQAPDRFNELMKTQFERCAAADHEG